jgi:hypothetical protein
MSAVRTFGFGLLGSVLGAVAGVSLGLLGGLGYTELASVSGFEGYSGFVVAYWMLGGLVMGAIAGIIIAFKRARRGGVD